MTHQTEHTPTEPREIRPIPLAELARRSGCARSSVSRAAGGGGAIAAAVLPSGFIDASHPAVAAFVSRMASRPSSSRQPRRELDELDELAALLLVAARLLRRARARRAQLETP